MVKKIQHLAPQNIIRKIRSLARDSNKGFEEKQSYFTAVERDYGINGNFDKLKLFVCIPFSLFKRRTPEPDVSRVVV